MASERDEIVAQVKKELLEEIYVQSAKNVIAEVDKSFERTRAAWSINFGYKTTA